MLFLFDLAAELLSSGIGGAGLISIMAIIMKIAGAIVAGLVFLMKVMGRYPHNVLASQTHRLRLTRLMIGDVCLSSETSLSNLHRTEEQARQTTNRCWP